MNAIHTDTALGQRLREESGEFYSPTTHDDGSITWHQIAPTAPDDDTCAHGIDNSTGYCASCEDASIDRASRVVARLRLTALGIATALFLTVTAPHGCTVTGTTSEGFPLASCANGTTVYADMDGNALAGLSYRAPGTWIDASGYVPMG
jgi:hypothetical protein